MRDYIQTAASIAKIKPIAVSLPLSSITPEDSLPVACFVVAESEKLVIAQARFSILELESSSASDPCSGSGKNTISTSFATGPLALLLLVKSYDPASFPWLQQVDASMSCPNDPTLSPDAVAPLHTDLGGVPREFSGPGTWTLVAYNNSTNRNVSVLGTVSARIEPA